MNKGRQIVGMTGMGLAAGSIALGRPQNLPTWPWPGLSLGAGWLYFTVGAYWSSTSDLSPTHAGSLSGLMNMGANLGGAISPTLTPWIAQQWGWGYLRPRRLRFTSSADSCGYIKPGDGLR